MRKFDVLTAASLALCAAFAPTPAGAAAAYVCGQEGSRIYADRPCDARTTPAPVPLPAPNGYAAPPVDRGAPAAARPGQGGARRSPRVAPAEPRHPRAGDPDTAASRLEARCRTLARRLERVEARLRAGYSVAEGERLKEQRRELREDRRWYACGRAARWPVPLREREAGPGASGSVDRDPAPAAVRVTRSGTGPAPRAGAANVRWRIGVVRP